MNMRSGDFNLTPVQAKLFALLQDGLPHTIPECLLVATGKRFASPSLVPTHIGRLRPLIAGAGYTIEFDGDGYRLVKPAGAAS